MDSTAVHRDQSSPPEGQAPPTYLQALADAYQVHRSWPGGVPTWPAVREPQSVYCKCCASHHELPRGLKYNLLKLVYGDQVRFDISDTSCHSNQATLDFGFTNKISWWELHLATRQDYQRVQYRLTGSNLAERIMVAPDCAWQVRLYPRALQGRLLLRFSCDLVIYPHMDISKLSWVPCCPHRLANAQRLVDIGQGMLKSWRMRHTQQGLATAALVAPAYRCTYCPTEFGLRVGLWRLKPLNMPPCHSELSFSMDVFVPVGTRDAIDDEEWVRLTSNLDQETPERSVYSTPSLWARWIEMQPPQYQRHPRSLVEGWEDPESPIAYNHNSFTVIDWR